MSSKMSSSDTQKSGRVLTGKNFKPKTDSYRAFPSSPDEEIVISGMAGRYPSCDNVSEYRHYLFNKVGFFELLRI